MKKTLTISADVVLQDKYYVPGTEYDDKHDLSIFLVNIHISA